MSIKKIPLNALIDILIDLYNGGVDYIDIHGAMDDKQDKIGISFHKDYINESYRNNFVDPENEEVVSHKLTDNDLNQLI